MEEQTVQRKRKGEPYNSPRRSKPYTRRRRDQLTTSWTGVFNIVGLIYPLSWEYPDVHVNLTNRICERFDI